MKIRWITAVGLDKQIEVFVVPDGEKVRIYTGEDVTYLELDDEEVSEFIDKLRVAHGVMRDIRERNLPAEDLNQLDEMYEKMNNPKEVLTKWCCDPGNGKRPRPNCDCPCCREAWAIIADAGNLENKGT